MATLLNYREIEWIDHYCIAFNYEDHDGWGFEFPCDAQGNIFPRKNDDAERNYQACLAGTNNTVRVPGVKHYEDKRIIPARVRCECGAIIELWDGMINGCHRCDREYNGGGQELAPRACWGEETGESLLEMSQGQRSE